MQKAWVLVAIVAVCAIAAYGGWKLRDAQTRQQPAIMNPATPETSTRALPGIEGGTVVPQRLESRTERTARIAAEREAQRSSTRAAVAAGQQNLEAAFRSEQPNATWARGKEMELERYVVNPQMDAINAVPTDFDVECKARTCRIQAEFASASAADDWAMLYLTNNGGLLPRSSLSKTVQPDGTVKLVMLGSTI